MNPSTPKYSLSKKSKRIKLNHDEEHPAHTPIQITANFSYQLPDPTVDSAAIDTVNLVERV
jgi:hypothetical protein